MATLWIARRSSGCRSSSSGHVALFGVVEEHFWRWLEGRPRVLRPQRVFYSTWLSRPSTRCRTSCCWSRNTGVSDHVRVYTRCASSVWTLLFGVFVAVFASLSSAVRCCLLILGCCRAFRAVLYRLLFPGCYRVHCTGSLADAVPLAYSLGCYLAPFVRRFFGR